MLNGYVKNRPANPYSSKLGLITTSMSLKSFNQSLGLITTSIVNILIIPYNAVTISAPKNTFQILIIFVRSKWNSLMRTFTCKAIINYSYLYYFLYYIIIRVHCYHFKALEKLFDKPFSSKTSLSNESSSLDDLQDDQSTKFWKK